MPTYLICNSKKKFPKTFDFPWAKEKITFKNRESKVRVDDDVADRLLRENPLLFAKVGYISDEELAEIKQQAIDEFKTQGKTVVDDAKQDTPETDPSPEEVIEEGITDALYNLSRQQIGDKIFEDFKVKISIAGKNKADLIEKYHEIENTPENER